MAHKTGAHILCYTLKQIASGNTTDYYEVFSDVNEDEINQLVQARQRLQALQQMEEDSNCRWEIYCWNICKVVETSEHYDL